MKKNMMFLMTDGKFNGAWQVVRNDSIQFNLGTMRNSTNIFLLLFIMPRQVYEKYEMIITI